MTTTTLARDLTAGMIIEYRGKRRVLLSDAHCDTFDGPQVWAYGRLRPMRGQPFNLCLPDDEPVEVIADREALIREGKMMRTTGGLVVPVGWGHRV
jgi:hypothetical protein